MIRCTGWAYEHCLDPAAVHMVEYLRGGSDSGFYLCAWHAAMAIRDWGSETEPPLLRVLRRLAQHRMG